MENVNEIIEELKSIIKKLDSDKSENTSSDIMNSKLINRVKLIGNKYPIKNHILCNRDEHIQGVYINILSSLLNYCTDDDMREKQLIFLQRIINGIENENITLDEIIPASMCINEEKIEEFVKIVDGEFFEAFVVDSLICLNIGCNDYNKALNYLSELYSLFNISEDRFNELVQLSKAILEQDDDKVFEINHLVNLNKFIGYTNMTIDSFVIYKINDLNIKGKDKVILINSDVKNFKEVLDLDKYDFDEITFLNCKFENIKKIVSINKSVFFKNCKFENMSPEIEVRNGILGGLINTVKERYSFLSLTNGSLENCSFFKCSSTKELICIKNGSIINCVFNKCESKECNSEVFLINVENCEVERCCFYSCKSTTNKENRNTTITGIIMLKNSSMEKCEFNDCTSYTQTSYGKYAVHKSYIVCALGSKIIQSLFNVCHSNSGYDYDGHYYKYIISLKDSIENNNLFNDCTADKNIMNV